MKVLAQRRHCRKEVFFSICQYKDFITYNPSKAAFVLVVHAAAPEKGIKKGEAYLEGSFKYYHQLSRSMVESLGPEKIYRNLDR
jgi:hypothetical protein